MPVEALSLPCYLKPSIGGIGHVTETPESRPNIVIWSLPFCAVDRIGFSVRSLPSEAMRLLPEKRSERQSKYFTKPLSSCEHLPTPEKFA